MLSKNMIVVKKTVETISKNAKVASIFVRKQSAWGGDKIVKSPYKNVEIPNMTVNDYVWQNLDRWPERTVSVCPVTGRGYTYEKAFKLSNSFGANLRIKFKIRDGDAVAVMLPNVPDYPLVVMGILEAGGVVTTVNPIYTAYEVQRQLQMSASKAIVTLPENVKTIKDALQLAKLDIPIIVIKTNGIAIPEGTVCFNELSEDGHVDTSVLKQVRRTANDICILPYSSGTTGMPKGVELSNRNIIANCEQINEPLVACHNETTATHQDSVMTILPFFHIYALSVIMFHKMSQGIKMVTLAKFQPETFLQALEKQRTNVLFAAPPVILLMASHPASSPKTYEHLEVVINGAAPLSPGDAERFLHRAQRTMDFRQGYGLTETSPVVTMTPRGLGDYSCVGRALPNTELKIVDDRLNSLGSNEKGELLVRGPQVMRGYRQNPQANADSFTHDGWFRTGDLAVISDDGLVTIADRLKELIKVKGFQVPPAELESVLRDHPEVADAAVVGVPHASHGETPKAFVVLKNNAKTDAQNIKDFVKERVASYKRIEDIVFIDSVPKSSAGKILRRVLKEQYC
ncbi:unnamed protein product [Plutella xylostella]|uniref:(diamondback moth) hypothetical protein n=1 Tax=Plutella xylostella TaxID=51655 RepID=A0A8S4DMA7_PLUXY|nr:unnamed protein product [Plutella xylostella]